MKKFRLLLLDANIVIELFRQGIWERVIELCDVYLSRTVAEEEAHFFVDEQRERQDFDLRLYAQDGRITVFDVMATEVASFCAGFQPSYMESLDPGEAESLAFLFSSTEACFISSADKIVYRVLGNLNRGDQGVSLEEVLQQIGLGRPLTRAFTKEYRQQWTQMGARERVQGSGWKAPPVD